MEIRSVVVGSDVLGGRFDAPTELCDPRESLKVVFAGCFSFARLFLETARKYLLLKQAQS